MNHKKVSWREKHGDFINKSYEYIEPLSLNHLRLIILEDVPPQYQLRLLSYINRLLESSGGK